MKPSRARRHGFTLLEVLVAVALLGLVVSVLARSAIQGMSYEGDASRRMRASLLADQTLSRVETAFKLGTPPQPMHEESQEAGEFSVSLDVQPFDLAQAGLGALLAPVPGAAGAAPPQAAAGSGASTPLPLFQVFVRVGWQEGLRELEVTRTTFAYDGSAAAQALGTGGEQESGDEQESGGEQSTPPRPEEEAQ